MSKTPQIRLADAPGNFFAFDRPARAAGVRSYQLRETPEKALVDVVGREVDWAPVDICDDGWRARRTPCRDGCFLEVERHTLSWEVSKGPQAGSRTSDCLVQLSGLSKKNCSVASANGRPGVIKGGNTADVCRTNQPARPDQGPD